MHSTNKNDLDKANAEVTNAILNAEKALDKALAAWKRVEDAEWSLVHLATNKEEQMAAQRGTAFAQQKIDLLKLMLGLLT